MTAVVLLHHDDYADWVFDSHHPTQGRTGYLDLAEASTINADEIDRRENEGSDPFDLFFPAEAWDAAFNSKVDKACKAAGYKWRDS